jgi:hypothetical protein
VAAAMSPQERNRRRDKRNFSSSAGFMVRPS